MEIVTKLNWVDILIVIIIIRMSYVAFQEGLSHEIFPLVGSIGTIVLCLHYYTKIGLFLHENMGGWPIEIANFLSFLVLAIVISFLFKVLKAIFDKIIKVTWHPLIEKFGGIAAGASRAAITVSIVLIIFMLMPLSYLQWSVRDKSLMGAHFLRIGPTIYEKISGFLPTAIIGGKSVSREDAMGYLMTDKTVAAHPEPGKEKSKAP